jgi:hypothetical protein
MHDVYAATLEVLHHRCFHRDRAIIPARAMQDIFSEIERQSKTEDAFYLKLPPDQPLDKADIRYPARSNAVVQSINLYDFKSLRVAQTNFTQKTFADFQKQTGSEASSRWEAVPDMPTEVGADSADLERVRH